MEHSFQLIYNNKVVIDRGNRYAVDTSSVSITLKLPDPTSILPGEAIFFMDLGGNFTKHPLTLIAENTTINSTANELVLDTNGDSIGLLWTGKTWRTYE